MHAIVDEDEHMERVLTQAFRDLARQGYWPHEVVAAAHTLYEPSTWHSVSPRFTSADTTFALLDEAHLRRFHARAILLASRSSEAAEPMHPSPPEEHPS